MSDPAVPRPDARIARRRRQGAAGGWKWGQLNQGVRTRIMTVLLVGLGGFIGASLRYLVGDWAATAFGSTFPYGTLLINVTGSFIIGLFLTAITDRFVAPPGLRFFIAVGMIGGYTTFSTYMFESLALIQARAYLAGMVNLFGSMLLGMLAVAAGTILGRIL